VHQVSIRNELPEFFFLIGYASLPLGDARKD